MDKKFSCSCRESDPVGISTLEHGNESTSHESKTAVAHRRKCVRVVVADSQGKGLRTLDALQLGAFTLLAEGEDDWQFIVADKTLAYVAHCENYSVITIVSHGFPT